MLGPRVALAQYPRLRISLHFSLLFQSWSKHIMLNIIPYL